MTKIKTKNKTQPLPSAAQEAPITVTQAAPDCWIVVCQVKSDRVVYFTSDFEYQAPLQGDWYYVHQHLGELPEQMTLANCWRWRYRGKDFLDTVEAHFATPTTALQRLVESNKQALRQMLTDKIHALRKPYILRDLGKEQARQLRLLESKAIQAGTADEAKLSLLPSAAAVRGISMLDMAKRTLAAHQKQQDILTETERVRDEIAVLIDQATTQDDLLILRERLMSDLAPEQNDAYAITPNNTTPIRQDAEPKPAELEQEQLRLRIQLRLKINSLRRLYVSDYLLDDVVVRYKGQIAQAVINKKMNDLNLRPLISLAAAQRTTLDEAAHSVLKEMDDTAQALLETEQMKEALLARIAAMKTFQDIEVTSQNIQALKLSPPAIPANITN